MFSPVFFHVFPMTTFLDSTPRALSGEGASLGVGVSVPYIYLIGNGTGSRNSTSNVCQMILNVES